MATTYRMATAEDLQDAELHAYEDGVRDGIDRAMQSPWIKCDRQDPSTYPPYPGRYIGIWVQRRKGSAPFRCMCIKAYIDHNGCVDYCKSGSWEAPDVGAPDYWLPVPPGHEPDLS